MKYLVQITKDGKPLASMEYQDMALASAVYADHVKRGAPCITLQKIPFEGAPITLQRATRH